MTRQRKGEACPGVGNVIIHKGRTRVVIFPQDIGRRPGCAIADQDDEAIVHTGGAIGITADGVGIAIVCERKIHFQLIIRSGKIQRRSDQPAVQSGIDIDSGGFIGRSGNVLPVVHDPASRAGSTQNCGFCQDTAVLGPVDRRERIGSGGAKIHIVREGAHYRIGTHCEAANSAGRSVSGFVEGYHLPIVGGAIFQRTIRSEQQARGGGGQGLGIGIVVQIDSVAGGNAACGSGSPIQSKILHNVLSCISRRCEVHGIRNHGHDLRSKDQIQIDSCGAGGGAGGKGQIVVVSSQRAQIHVVVIPSDSSGQGDLLSDIGPGDPIRRILDLDSAITGGSGGASPEIEGRVCRDAHQRCGKQSRSDGCIFVSCRSAVIGRGGAAGIGAGVCPAGRRETGSIKAFGNLCHGRSSKAPDRTVCSLTKAILRHYFPIIGGAHRQNRRVSSGGLILNKGRIGIGAEIDVVAIWQAAAASPGENAIKEDPAVIGREDHQSWIGGLIGNRRREDIFVPGHKWNAGGIHGGKFGYKRSCGRRTGSNAEEVSSNGSGNTNGGRSGSAGSFSQSSIDDLHLVRGLVELDLEIDQVHR